MEQDEWKKGPWTPEEDKLLVEYVSQHGEGRWSCASNYAGGNLKRSGKSCRLRWVNYLRPGLKKGHLTPQEEGIIIELHSLWGNKWSTIARYLPGRTDNEIKNYWRTHFKKKSNPNSEKNHHQQQQQVKRKSLSQKQKLEAAEDQITSDGKLKGEQLFETTSEYTNIENHNIPYLPMIEYDENRSSNTACSDDFIPDENYLWGGLWNLDCQNNGTAIDDGYTFS